MLANEHRKKMREVFTELRGSGADRDLMRETMSGLRKQLEKDVQAIVPGENVEPIIRTLSSGGSGFGGRRR